MEMILCSAEVNTNEITGPSLRAFMDDVTLVAESRFHIEQLVTHLQQLFKWVAMKIKPEKCHSFTIIEGNCREIKFFVDRNKIPTIRKEALRVSVTATPYHGHHWQDLSKLLKEGLCYPDKCDLLNKDKVMCIYFGLFPKLLWLMRVYELSITKIETMERLISKYTKKWLEVPNTLTNVALYS